LHTPAFPLYRAPRIAAQVFVNDDDCHLPVYRAYGRTRNTRELERRLAEEAERENLRFIGSMIGSGRV
jgi:hypothetical protein